MKSFTPPTSELVHAAIDRMSSPAHERYFFSALVNPLWIEPLRKERIFEKPLPAERFPDGSIRYQKWPPSQYLARMAKEAPEEVTAVLEEITTDNWCVIHDMLDAAKAMPARFGVRLVPKIEEAAKGGVLRELDLKDIGEVCAHIAGAGKGTMAMRLARTAFNLKRLGREDRDGRREAYWYGESLKGDVVPALVKVRPRELVVFLLEQLDRGVRAIPYSSEKDDSSTAWRAAVEEHDQNSDHEIAAKLVGCIREAAESSIANGGISLVDVLGLVERHEFPIFKRIRIHLIDRFADQAGDLVRETMMDRSLFDDYRFKYEYGMLAGRHFDLLDQEERATFLGWIDEGPDLSGFDDRIRANLDREPTDEDREQRRDWWRFQKWHWIRDHLEGERLAHYERMRREHGEPEFAYLNMIVRTRWGSESPYTADELSELSFEEVVEKLSEWKEEPERAEGPAYEGLAQQFGQYVRTNLRECARQATRLEGHYAIYVRRFLEAVRESTKEYATIDLKPTLALCKWVLGRPADEDVRPPGATEPLVDKDWRWTRNTIADLVRDACRAKVDQRYRDDLWHVVDELRSDVHVSAEPLADEEFDPRTADFLTPSLNRPAGHALHALLAFAHWVAEASAVERDGRKVIEGGFEKVMPEVRNALEDILTKGSADPFVAHAVFGWRLGLLYWVDRQWITERAATIFDLSGIETDPTTAYGWAAWSTFLLACRPHIEFYNVLREQFSFAVDHIKDVKYPRGGHNRALDHLGEHLMVLYGRGDVDLESDDKIIQRLLTKTIEPVRTHAIEFVGRSLRQQQDKVPPAAIERFKKLWEWHWKAIGKQDAEKDPTAATFGYWFSSGAFDAKWSLQNLEAFVEVVRKPEPDDRIVEQLVKFADADPALAVSILGRLVEGDDEGWRVIGWRKNAREVLETGMNAGGAAAAQAEDIINQLGRRGMLEFEELLPETT
ncbi:MAG: hypothetical protein SYC29_04665 [Planctomycetota bacterium]|nr:hypothetical protein [Planctomycetota bacterium]